MKKIYFLLVALMMSMAANAAYDYFVSGEFKNWGDWTRTALAQYQLKPTAEAGVYQLDFTQTPYPNLSGKFVIAAFAEGSNAPDWNAKIGTKTGVVKAGVPYYYAVGGSDLNVDGTVANCKMTLDTNKGTLLLEGQEFANSFDTVYMIGDFGDGWNTNTTAYPLPAKAGAKDTYEATLSISGTAAMSDFFYTVPKCGTVVLGPSGEDLAPQFGRPYNLMPGSDKAISLKPGVYTFQVVATQEAKSCTIIITSTGEQPEEDIVYYFDNRQSGWSEVYAYYSNDSAEEEYYMEETSVAGIFEGYATNRYTKVKFTDGGSNSTPVYDLKNSYIYSTTNAGEEYFPPRDWSAIYVNVLGDFNGWADNGVNPNGEGIATLRNLAIGTKSFKVKIWDGKAETWLSTGDYIAPATWVAIPGNSNSNMAVTGATDGQRFDVSFNCNNNSIYVAPAAEDIDFSKFYVNVVGDFNEWQYNGVNPDREGIAILEAENVNTSFKIKVWNGESDEWFAKSGTLALDTWNDILGNQDEMVLPAEAQSGDVTMTFNYLKGELKVVKGAGVNGVTVDDENAPVEYFNLQGVRVENPAEGLYIRRQGSKTAKVIL